MESVLEKVLRFSFLFLQLIVGAIVLRMVFFYLGYKTYIPYVDTFIFTIVNWLQEVGFKLFRFSPF